MTNPIGHLELGRIGRLLLILFVMFAVFNHTVRACALGAGDVGTGMGSFTSGDRVVNGLNDVRQGMGFALQRTAAVCPDKIEGGCHTVVALIREIIGLQE